MITLSNYPTEVKNINWGKVPADVKDNRNDFEDLFEFYNDDKDIKETLDLYFKKLSKYKKSSEPKVLVVKPATKVNKNQTLKPENLSQFKTWLKYNKGTTLYYEYLNPTQNENSFGTRVPNTIQTNSVGFITEKESESWLDYGPAKNWTFTDQFAQWVSEGKYPITLKYWYEKPKGFTLDKKQSKKSKAVKSSSTPKSQKKLPVKIDAEMVSNYNKEFMLIRRFFNMVNSKNPVTFRKIQLLYMAFQKSIVSREVRKTSKEADLFVDVNKKVVKLFDAVKENENNADVSLKDKSLYNKIETFVKSKKVNYAVTLLRSFIGMQNTTPEVDKAERLLKRMSNAVSKGKVDKNNRLYTKIKEAINELKSYVKEPKNEIEVEAYGLTGGIKKKKVNFSITDNNSEVFLVPKKNIDLIPKIPMEKNVLQKIVKPKNNNSSSNLKTTFMPKGFIKANKAPEQNNTNIFYLKGQIGKFLQKLQRYRLMLLVHGESGAGKSEFVKQLANEFLNAGFKGGFFDLEQGGLISKDTQDSINRNITPINQENIAFTDEAPNGLQSIKDAAKHFDFIILDSWQKLNTNIKHLDELRIEHPNTIWIIIVQETVDGKAKGGSQTSFDPPIRIKGYKVDNTFVNNYVEIMKNRGNQSTVGTKYNISKKIVIDDNIENEISNKLIIKDYE